jgi:hypothetical protein
VPASPSPASGAPPMLPLPSPPFSGFTYELELGVAMNPLLLQELSL